MLTTVTVNDDAPGTNTLSLSGMDAGNFKINGRGELAFTETADFESKSSYSVTVEVNDPDIGSTPNDIQDFSLTVNDVPEKLAITDGSAAGLDFSSEVSSGTSDNPVGIFEISAVQSGPSFEGVTITNNSPGVEGISAVRLYWSSDRTLEPNGGDTQLGEVTTDASSAPSTIKFDGFSQSIPTSAHYAILAIDVESEGSAEVRFELAQDGDLQTPGGELATVNENNQSSFANLFLSNGATALPVEMARFEGTQTESGVRLQWETASEQNNAGFRILRKRAWERASEGSWTKVGYVEGSGTTSEAQTYQFTDADLPYTADSLAYRLKQVDTDGTTSLTDSVTVVRSAPDGLQILGTVTNPTRQRATVRFAVPEAPDVGEVTMFLYDVVGRQVRTVKTEVESGRHETHLDVSDLSSGVYILRMRGAGQAVTHKLTVVQ